MHQPLTRTDRWTKAGGISGHSIPFCCLGFLILDFGFLAFNAGSQGSITNAGDGEAFARAAVNTQVVPIFNLLNLPKEPLRDFWKFLLFDLSFLGGLLHGWHSRPLHLESHAREILVAQVDQLRDSQHGLRLRWLQCLRALGFEHCRRCWSSRLPFPLRDAHSPQDWWSCWRYTSARSWRDSWNNGCTHLHEGTKQ